MVTTELATRLIEGAFSILTDNISGRGDPAVRRGERAGGLTIEAALFTPPGGYRSVLGTLKHVGGWGHVYYSYAFDTEPKHWNQTSWPRGHRDSIDATQEYLDEVIKWVDHARRKWTESLAALSENDLLSARPVHWGATAPLLDIVVMVANHVVYHAGEINQLLAVYREEGWEEGEEVEENHLPSDGHRVIPLWMSEQSQK